MMTEPTLQPDVAEIARHLTHITSRWHELDQPCCLELVFLNDQDQAAVRNVERFDPTPEGIAAAAEHAAAMNIHRLNAYAVVNPVDATRPLRAGKRASTEDIVASFYQFADADSEQAANNIRNFVGPKCTFSVTTGTAPCVRPHVYWELEEPTRNLQAWSETQRSIAQVLATDSVIDPPRIMRLAGTINWPKPKKAAKGYIPEVTKLTIFSSDTRGPVSAERLRRAFAGAAPAATTFHVDTGNAQPIDRERLAIQAMSGKEWHNAVIRLVASYVAKGLSDAEIHALTQPLTLPGYTADDTASEVQVAINGARAKGYAPSEPEYRQTFDFDAAAAPEAGGWRVQTAADFTADFVAPEYIIDGIVQRGRLYTLTAPTGSGKTAVMLYAATAIATGGQFCGKDVEGGDVLFMAGENPDDVRARVIATMEFYGIDATKCRLHFIPGTFSIRADMERLRQESERLPNLIMCVIDTFAAYFDGDDENSNAQALDFARVVRGLTGFPSKPCVIMPAHPVKNATRSNLTPKGGSSLLNEVDGNLTLWNTDGLISLHWQGKFRGADFEPLTLELEKFQSDRLKDSKGRLIPTILAKPVLSLRAQQIARETLRIEDQLLISIANNDGLSIRERCQELGILREDGTPNTSRISRLIDRLAKDKMIKKLRRKWVTTEAGDREVSSILNGASQPLETDE